MKVALISDTHVTVEDAGSNSLWPHQLKRVQHRKGAEAVQDLYARIRESTHLAWNACYRWLKKEKPSVIIHLGDVVGGRDEQGCHFPDARVELTNLHAQLKELTEHVYWCPGQHDFGYAHERMFNVPQPNAGFNKQSVQVGMEVFGHLWWKHMCENHMVIGICAALAAYEGSDEDLLQLKQQQEDFIRETLEQSHQRWVLCTHDFHGPLHITHLLRPHMQRFACMVYGDLHNTWAGSLIKNTAYLGFWNVRSRVLAQCLRRSRMVGSVAPLWGKGHNAALLHANSDFSVHPVRYSPVATYTKPPTTSALRCLLWMSPWPAR